jgi:hypothetical protein
MDEALWAGGESGGVDGGGGGIDRNKAAIRRRLLGGGRFGEGGADPFVAALVEFCGQFGAPRLDDPATEHDVRPMGDVVLEELLVVGDDQDSHRPTGSSGPTGGATDPGDALAGETDGIGIEATVGLVEDRKPRLEHRQLEDLGTLHLTAGEAFVDVPSGKLRVDRQFRHLRLEFGTELLHRHQFLPLFALRIADVGDRMPEEIGQPHAGDRHRTLKGEKHPRPRPFVGFHREEVVPRAVGFDQLDRAGGDLIRGMPHDRVAERALSRAVRAHERVNLPSADGQVDPLEDLLPLHGDMETTDDELVGLLRWLLLHGRGSVQG